MKTILFALFMIAASTLNAQTYKVDTGSSTLKWNGKKVTGGHFGFISLKEGNLMISNDQITQGKFVIDMNSITCTDLEDEGYNKKLVGHLKSDDFFGVAKYPEAVLEITGSSVFENNTATVEARLTIKGITHPVTFTATKDGNNYSARIVVDRAKYDVRYGSGSFFDNLGNNLIYDEFTLDVNLVHGKS
jgi:polyisoprenoid-binding protein YceI